MKILFKALVAMCAISMASGVSASVIYYADSVISSTETAPVGRADFVLGDPDLQLAQFIPQVGGAPGFVTVEMQGEIEDLTGDDIFVVVYDWLANEIEEFTLFASNNGTDFLSLGATGTPFGTTSRIDVGFDLNDAGLSSARYFRLVNRYAFNDVTGADIDAFYGYGTASVPEPTTTALLALGLFGVGAAARRRKVN